LRAISSEEEGIQELNEILFQGDPIEIFLHGKLIERTENSNGDNFFFKLA